MQTSQEGFKISRGRTEIEVPHGEGEITFVLPSYGPGTFREVMPKIDNAGLLRATTAQTVSLIYQAFQHKNELECQDILEILNSPNRHLWTGTEDLVVDEGVFVYDNADGKMFGDRAFAEMYLLEDRASLEKMFNVKDSRVRFVPFGFKLGDQSTRQFAKNPYVIAHVGEENADVIAEIADKFKHKPKVWGKGMNLVDLDVKRYTGLSSEWGFCIGRYTFSGRYKGDSDGGCAFGVKKD